MVGITPEGVAEMDALLFIELKGEGAEVLAGDEIGCIESVKTVHPILSPVSGVIARSNASAVSDPGIVAESPYGEGWLFEIEESGPDAGLMGRREYLEKASRGTG